MLDSSFAIRTNLRLARRPGDLSSPLSITRLECEKCSQSSLTIGAWPTSWKLPARLRYKEPTADKSTEREYPLKTLTAEFAKASTDFRFASAVAAFGMLLRDSHQSGNASWPMVKEIAASALGPDDKGYRTEFLDLVRVAQSLPSLPKPPAAPHGYPRPTYPSQR